MKILIIAHDAGEYGATKSLLSICEHFHRKSGFKLHVIVPSNGAFVMALKSIDIPYSTIPFLKWTFPQHPTKETRVIAFKNYVKRRRHALNCFINYSYILKKLVKISNEFKPDVVYTNTITHPLGVMLSKKIKKPHIWHIREFIEEHGIHFVFGLNLVKLFLNKSTKNIYISNSLQQKFDSHGKQSSVVVPNGILLKEKITGYKAFVKQRMLHKPIRLLSLGRISKGKRHDVAISLLSILIKEKNINAELCVTGAGNTKSLELLAQKIGLLDKIKFTGHINNVFEMYETNDILIVGSEMEGFGRVTAEAMATGMIVIGRNTGGTKDIISHAENGFLFNEENEIPDIIKTITSNNQRMREIRINANESVLKRFSLEQYYAKMNGIFQSDKVNPTKDQ